MIRSSQVQTVNCFVWGKVIGMEYVKIVIAALMPVAVSVLLYILNRKTGFGRINEKVKQLIFGIVFGILAIAGTEWGVDVAGSQTNCRDASVLTAGLMFGGPAGIIAGIIGGVERWLATFWGIPEFTRLACTIATIFAGLYSAFLRKYMFENKKPGVFISFAIGVVMEVIHMMMVFLTNMDEPDTAMEIVKANTSIMVVVNATSVMLTAFFLSVISGEKRGEKREKARISQTVQRWLLFTVVLAFLITSVFIYALQNREAQSQTDTTLELAVDEVSKDVTDASDSNLLALTKLIKQDVGRGSLEEVTEKYNVTEISLINSERIITESTVPVFVGFDMNSGEQSLGFIERLEADGEYVQEYGPIAYDNSVKRKYSGVAIDGGYLQVGYDSEQFQKDLYDQMQRITKNRHVGQEGFILVTDQAFNAVCVPENKVLESVVAEDSSIEPAEDETFTLLVNGERYYGRYRDTEGYYILALLPEKEALKMRNIALYVNTFLEILVFAILFGLIYMLIKHVVVNQIKSINASLSKITSGDLNEVVDVRTSEEFASLSDDINMTVDSLKGYIAEASARIDKELEFAKQIQCSALPGTFPAFPKHKEFDIFANMDPAKEVGGDFYDFYMTDENTLHFLVADVSGKGIPAAMFMMRAKQELKTLTEAEMTIDQVFTKGNDALCEGNDAGMFVTAWQGGIDLKTGIVKFANAGHNPPLVRHGDGRFEYLRSKAGFVLAGMEGIKYKPQELQLLSGDMIFLYTDGVTEATDSNEELFGEERLLNVINSKEFTTVKEMCEFIKSEVETFVGEAPQFDDITMLAFKYFGEKADPSIHFDCAQISDITETTAFVESELEKADFPMKAVTQISIAIDEIFSNIVNYGYPDKKGPITVSLNIADEGRTARLTFVDEGIPYNPVIKDDPDVTLSIDERQIGGLGIFMVKKSMDDMRYRYENGCNILTITKRT